MGNLMNKEGGWTMQRNEKSRTEEQIEKKQLKKQEQVTKNTLTDRNRIPDEQNAWKETQSQYR